MATVKFTVGGFVLNPAPHVPYINDSFNRADGPLGTATEGQVSQAWENVDAQGFVIMDGTRARASYAPAGTTTNYRVLQEVGTPDFYVETILGPVGTMPIGSLTDPGIMARFSSTSSYLRLEYHYGEGFRLRNVGGGGSNTVLHASGITAWTAGAALKLKAVGDQVTYGVGDQLFTVTAPNNLTGTKAGLIAKASDTLYGGTFDSFKVEIGENIPA